MEVFHVQTGYPHPPLYTCKPATLTLLYTCKPPTHTYMKTNNKILHVSSTAGLVEKQGFGNQVRKPNYRTYGKAASFPSDVIVAASVPLTSWPVRASRSAYFAINSISPCRLRFRRTMQRRVREWRRQILVTFNAKWLELDRFGLTQPSAKAAGDNGCGKDSRFATVENPSGFPLSHSFDDGKTRSS